MTDDTPIADLPNLGPQSASWLRSVHIENFGHLREQGPVSSYLMLKAAGYKVSLNLLYAMFATLHHKSWLAVTAEEKLILQQALQKLG